MCTVIGCSEVTTAYLAKRDVQGKESQFCKKWWTGVEGTLPRSRQIVCWLWPPLEPCCGRPSIFARGMFKGITFPREVKYLHEMADRRMSPCFIWPVYPERTLTTVVVVIEDSKGWITIILSLLGDDNNCPRRYSINSSSVRVKYLMNCHLWGRR